MDKLKIPKSLGLLDRSISVNIDIVLLLLSYQILCIVLNNKFANFSIM